MKPPEQRKSASEPLGILSSALTTEQPLELEYCDPHGAQPDPSDPKSLAGPHARRDGRFLTVLEQLVSAICNQESSR